MDSFEFLCCLCNQKIIEDKTDPLSIDIVQNQDLLTKTGCKQLFDAHFDCFKEKLHPYFKKYFIRFGVENENELDFQNLKEVKSTKCFIQKIIELQNVDQWKVIYYGFELDYIDEQFILNYCYELIEQKIFLDQFVLDIAGITHKNQLEILPKKIAEKIGNHEIIMGEQWNYYNKIWIYLLSAADMCVEKIIK